MKRFAERVLIILACVLLVCATALADPEAYTVRLKASVSIYQGPGADFGYLKKVGEDGVYTIAGNAFDEYGNLWGRLKSGAGWVMLEAKVQIVVHEVPYTTSLKANDDICAGPGYVCGYLKKVGEDGVYTIVEEAVSTDGFLWGRLKSGAGWVKLTDAPIEVPAASSDAGYLVSLDAWVPIYDRPCEAEGICTGIVGEDGVYTIVSEAADEYGNIWGKLKSGAGWVNLNYVRMMGNPPITAYFADVVDVGASWYEYTADVSEYMTQIAFRANERLEDVKFTTLRCGDVYEIEEIHYGIDCLKADTYFVAGVVFYGDMTTYGISFVDKDGEERYYAVSLSGMNGALVMNEYVP